MDVEEYVEDVISSAVHTRESTIRASAASTIQRWTRSRLTAFRRIRRSIVVVQSIVRGRKARRGFREAETAQNASERDRSSSVPPASPFEGLQFPEIDIMDPRTDKEKRRSQLLTDKYMRSETLRFSSPLLARAFLQESSQLEHREANVRRGIVKQISANQSQFQSLLRTLNSRHQLHLEERQRLNHREERQRKVIAEETSLHWAAIVRLHLAVLWGEEWAEKYTELSRSLQEAEAELRQKIEKEQVRLRVESCCAEVDERKWISKAERRERRGVGKASSKKSSLHEALEYSKQNYGFSQEFSASLVHLRSRREIERLEQLNQTAIRAEEVRRENALFERRLDDARVKQLSLNFYRAVKQRDEAKARRKVWNVSRQSELEHLREVAKREELASRRSVYESRHPNERDAFKSLLQRDDTHTRRIPVKTPQSRQLSPVRASSTPLIPQRNVERETSYAQRRSPTPRSDPPRAVAEKTTKPIPRSVLPAEDKLRTAVTTLHLLITPEHEVLGTRPDAYSFLSAPPEEVTTTIDRILSWNDRARAATSSKDFATATSLLENADIETKRLRVTLSELQVEKSAIDATVNFLGIKTETNHAVLSRETRQLRLALRHLIKALKMEESLYSEATPETLLNTSAVLVQLDEPGEAINYARQAESLLTQEAMSIVAQLRTGIEPQIQCRILPNQLFSLSVTALHNVAMAQAVCPRLLDHRPGDSGQQVPLATEKASAKESYDAAHQMSDMLFGANHPLTQHVRQSSVKIASLLSAH